ncbi:Internalin-A precursor [Roseovarius litorisediminis]|uniref:Internalin-A n=1 Tax=Roseovarius litorisediminis TaxID=1312363 RepID=A0A1Y5THY6_9RHOB|nr:leucine-rich repeat domain-containing protein [Roseovarius litorisediminis]SLN64071.1 Internalin-A precursor [Roseovarius litorisediminis]
MRKLFLFVVVLALLAAVAILPRNFQARQQAQKDFEEASQRIKATIAAGKTVLDFSDLPRLRQLPDEIGQLPDLWHLNLAETEISSLGKISQLPQLKYLSLRNTRVHDLAPLVGNDNLEFLDIGKTLVQDLEPLTQIRSLERVDIGSTEILTLEPATRIRRLIWINLHRSYAHDGSRKHYDRLFETVPEVFNGSAFKQNYVPAPLYLLKTQLNRLADRLYLPRPFPRP